LKRIICLIAVMFLMVFAGGSTATVQSSDNEASVSSTETTIPESPALPTDTEAMTDITTEITTEPPILTEIITDTETVMSTETSTVPADNETAPPPVTEPPVTEAPVTEPPVTEPTPSVDEVISWYFGPQLPVSDITTIPLAKNPSIDPAKPMLALTFDDGPSAHTERLLNIFKAHGGKGTFFVVGNSIGGKEATLSRMAAEGHEIGIHTWWHPQLTTLTDVAIVDEILMTRAKIYSATGVDTRIVRPPYGAIDDRVKAIGAKTGVCFVNWSVDTVDWRTRNATAVYNEVMNGARNGAIILCHDLHGSTVDAMETVIPKLIADGYQLVTVSELLSYSNTYLVPGGLYNRQ